METTWRMAGKYGQQQCGKTCSHMQSLCLVRPSEKPNYLALPSAGGPVSDRSA